MLDGETWERCRDRQPQDRVAGRDQSKGREPGAGRSFVLAGVMGSLPGRDPFYRLGAPAAVVC